MVILTKNNLLNYNFGSTAYPDTLPDPMYVGLAITTAISSTFSVVPTALSYLLKVVTITVANDFTAGDTVTVSGVNTAFSVTNVDGVWTLDSANSTTLVFTVSVQPTGSTPQTLTGGSVTRHPTEPAVGDYARVAIDNDKTTWTVSTLGTLTNDIDVVFPEASADWGTALSIFIADAATNGNIWWYDTLVPTIPVLDTMVVTFDAGSIVVSM